MTDKPIRIIDDKREILAIHWSDGERCSTARTDGYRRIVPYEERGGFALTTWLAVYEGDARLKRVPIDHVCIEYKREGS